MSGKFKLIILLVLVVGCQSPEVVNNHKYVQTTNKELVFRVVTLQHKAEQLSAQANWFRVHLEKCLTELEKEKGLEPMEFDWLKAEGYPKCFIRDPNIPKRNIVEPQPFYAPYHSPKVREIEAEAYQDTARLSASVGLTNTAITMNMALADRYIEHFEQRLKRLEGHLKE
ncbi:MAG TPA: hypothetical protein ENH43_01350 [Phycisphaerales bacterium]|nr:hypothetical protein [Phycisphaerales bacterium]